MSYDITTLRGIVPPVVTPLHPDFTVDYASFTNVIEHLIAGGVHGLFFLGSTSEVIFHDLATRRKILEHAVKVTNGRLPVLAGAVDPTTDRVIGNARAASEVGVDAVVVTAPFYTLTSQPEIIEHFRYVRDGIDIPVVAYDLPVCVHSKLERASVVTSGDTGNFRYVLSDLANLPGAFVMTGGELAVDCDLLLGAHGAVPGLGNVDPGGYVRLYDAARRGDWAAARAEQARLCRLFEIIGFGTPRTSRGASGVGGFKTAMQAMGIIASNTMARPQRTLDATEAGKVREVLRDVALV
jgi:4-hydroxy-tetrahydrodipicolinate synthase